MNLGKGDWNDEIERRERLTRKEGGNNRQKKRKREKEGKEGRGLKSILETSLMQGQTVGLIGAREKLGKGGGGVEVGRARQWE